MKKTLFILTLVAVFTLSTMSMVFAKEGKVNPGQAKKEQVTTKAQTTIKTQGTDKKTTPAAVELKKEAKVTVVKIGRLQLPVGPLKAVGAKVLWDGKSTTVVIEKGTSSVTVTVTVVNKKTSKVFVNGKEVVQKGNGAINPTKQILTALGVQKPATTTPAGVQVTTPGAIQTTSPAAVTK